MSPTDPESEARAAALCSVLVEYWRLICPQSNVPAAGNNCLSA